MKRTWSCWALVGLILAFGLAYSTVVQAQQVVINEIHYNPFDPVAPDPDPDGTDDAQEFVELHNPGTAAVNISGWQLAGYSTAGYTFPANTTIPAGGYVVVAKYADQLLAATGYSTPYDWPDTDSLSNGGEPITLLNDLGLQVDGLVYDDVSPWPVSPDGSGPSLELKNPALDNGVGGSWAASSGTHGTPGAQNSSYTSAPRIASTSPANGASVPALTQISITFNEAVTGVSPDDLAVNGVVATGVSGSGAGPYVFAVADPPESAMNVVLSGTGGIQNGAATPFAGASWVYYDHAPKVVINELNYNAYLELEQHDFFELYNNDTVAFDISQWAISKGIVYTFPDGTLLDPGEYLVLARDAVALRTLLPSIPAEVTVLQWTSGNLSNGGETVELVDSFANVIDTTTYDDSGEWPTSTDGGGPSLELINPALPNTVGAAWRASTGTYGTPGQRNSVWEENPAPIVSEALHQPVIPQPNQPVTITARVVDDAGAPQSVTLHHRLDAQVNFSNPNPYIDVPMVDDGTNGDVTAGDALYTAVVAGLANDQQMDFYISASDGVNTAAAPPYHETPDAKGNPSQTFLCKFSNEVLPADFPVYHMLITQANRAWQESLTGEIDGKTKFDATFIDDKGNLWYNVTERYRGQSSMYIWPRSFRIDFPSARPLDSVLGFPTYKLQLLGHFPVRQKLGYELFNKAGIPAPMTGWVRFRSTGHNYDTFGYGSDGFYGLYCAAERIEGDFLDSQGGTVSPPRDMTDDGNLYRGEHDGDLRWEGWDPDAYRTDLDGRNGYSKENNEEEDYWTDLIDLIDWLNNHGVADEYVTGVKARIDENEWAGFFGVHTVMGNREGAIYRDTGDDYYIYFNPPTEPSGWNSQLIPWDLDAVLTADNETIWRQNVNAVRRWIRHNAFAPYYLRWLRNLLDGAFSQVQMDALIDSMPDAAFAPSGGSDTYPLTKAQFKNWTRNRRTFMENEIRDGLTLAGVPASPYEATDPVIQIFGLLDQNHTATVRVNGELVTFDIYAGTWSKSVSLVAGMNDIIVEAFDLDGVKQDEATGQVFYNPPGSQQLSLWMRAPRRMINDKPLTIEAKIVDEAGRPDYTKWSELGTVSVVRLPDRTPVAITVTVFDSHIAVPDDSIRFYSGWGSVSFTLDEGAAFTPGDVEITVNYAGMTDSQVVAVIGTPAFRTMSGMLIGPDLIWGPNENLRVTGNATVPEGSTLTIHPGTLVMVDTTGGLESGTLITVNGRMDALGTEDNPIQFFSERGPLAMTLTQSGSASNVNCWRGFQFYGSASSTFQHVFLSGAGNGPVVSHPRPPVLGMFNTHSVTAERCVFADNNGMVFSGQGTGTYTIQRNLVSRAGIGGEFFGNGHTLLIDGTWWTSTGRAPESANLDGDHIHIDGAASNQLIRNCVFADGGDDGIDHNGSNFTVEDSIIWDIDDKAISMTGGHATLRNVLIFSTVMGVRGTASLDHVTINVGAPLTFPDVVQGSIIWPSALDTCGGTVNYTDVGEGSNLGCGTGNFSANPLFVNTSAGAYDFNLQADSPAKTAGPGGTRIGWLGFPDGAICASGEDCNDNNPCTFDSCDTVAQECQYTPIAACRLCTTDLECDDGNVCTTDTCQGDLTCQSVATVADEGRTCDDGRACTAPDACSAGACVGPESCPPGQHCNALDVCSVEAVTTRFQDGTSGYTGTVDTWLTGDAPDTVRGFATEWRWDNSPVYYGLIRFEGIFGSGAGQIPPGSQIISATLAITISNATDAAGEVREVLAPWNETTTTFNNFGGDPGAQSDEYGPTVIASAPTALGIANIDVRASLQAWASNPSANLGWIFLAASEDGAYVRSADYATISERPSLTVTFAAPSGCVVDGDCDDGLYCNGTETCNIGTGQCQAGASVICSDAVDCTITACDETLDACTTTPDVDLCDDGNPCTIDTCDLLLGCQHPNSTDACSDGDACTTGDVCSGGICLPGGPLSCDDGVACTEDSCNQATGCASVSNCPEGEYCDLGSGVCEAATSDPLPIVAGSEWKYFKGTAEPTPTDLTAWTRPGFDDQGWLSGPSGFGYGGDCAAGRGTALTDMQNGYVSVYLRHGFFVSNPGGVSSLTLTVDYDDAFVAYINGTQVAIRNITGAPPLRTAVATADHECSACDGTCNAADVIDLSAFIDLLVAGDNVIAIQGHNASSASSDFTLLPTLSSVEEIGCTSDADCNDQNPCTDDTCNTVSGICAFTPDNSNVCSDGVVCTTDVCSAGACASTDACPAGQSCNYGTGTCETAPVVVSFQQGSGGYTGAVDTYLHAGAPTADNSAASTLVVDGAGTVPADERQILLRFNGLFQSEGGPIPNGSTINSALLRINVTNPSANGAEFHRMLLGWADTDSWNSLVNGVQRDDAESVTAADVTSLYNGATPTLHTVNVTSSVAAWSAGAANRGWVLVTPGAGTDSWQFDSAEAATLANRPLLTVDYTPPLVACGNDGDCDDGLFCNGAETCNVGAGGICQPGPAPSCGDGVACTTDSCNEATNSCDHVPNAAACSDGTVCTIDTCDPILGCRYANDDGVACELNACWTGETCSGGTCDGGTAVDCDDGVACTIDDCDPSDGCSNVSGCPIGAVCNLVTGVCESSPVLPLPIAAGSTWSYFKGSVEPPADWTALLFDDAGWLSGPSSFGYGTDCAADRGTALSDMQNGYLSLYLRHLFLVPNPSRVTSLTLTVDYDDAFVVYLNGTEVARRNVVGSPPAHDQVATVDHECSVCGGTCNPSTVIDLTAVMSLLTTGNNVLAIQAHNLDLASSDFTILPVLSSTESSACTTDAECYDGIACTDDVCNLNVCSNTDNCPTGQACNETSGACELETMTASFQDGVGAYTGTRDTYLAQSAPAAANGAAAFWRWDSDNPGSSNNWEYGLIRFDDIVGGGIGQVPQGSTIQSATLTIYVENGSAAPAGEVNEVSTSWDEATTTWNTFGGEAGVQADEYGAVVGATPLTAGSVNIDVTASVQKWADDPLLNRGWVFRPNNVDGVQVTSAEGATAANRPKLTVQYSIGIPTCDDHADCEDGLWCNGSETCVSGSCQSGTPPSCDDGVACTTDSCNEAADACDHTSCAVTVSAEGSRYLAVTPPAGVTTVALRVGSDGLTCMPRFVTADGTLGLLPEYRTPAEWGTVHVYAQQIAPGRLYTVEALRTGDVPIGSGSATTWAWGDADNANGVDIFDILCVLDGSQNKFVKCSLYATDMRGPTPNGVVDNDDIKAVLDAYESKPYPESDPCSGIIP